MSAEAWVGAVAVGITVLGGLLGWATYVAWMLSQMNSNIKALRNEAHESKSKNASDHKELWSTVHELAKTSQAHENRLVRLEAKGGS